MHRTIETLMNEHRVIEQVLAVLEAAAVLDEAGTPVARSRVSELGEFFKGFADTCHHGKEEDVLFRIMSEVGFCRRCRCTMVGSEDPSRLVDDAPGSTSGREAFSQHLGERLVWTD